MKKIAFLICCCVLSSFARAKGLPIDAPEAKAAKSVYDACLVDQIQLLDDGVSDVRNIAMVSQYMCQKEYFGYLSSWIQDSRVMDVFDKQYDRDNILPIMVDVLHYRKSRP